MVESVYSSDTDKIEVAVQTLQRLISKNQSSHTNWLGECEDSKNLLARLLQKPVNPQAIRAMLKVWVKNVYYDSSCYPTQLCLFKLLGDLELIPKLRDRESSEPKPALHGREIMEQKLGLHDRERNAVSFDEISDTLQQLIEDGIEAESVEDLVDIFEALGNIICKISDDVHDARKEVFESIRDAVNYALEHSTKFRNIELIMSVCRQLGLTLSFSVDNWSYSSKQYQLHLNHLKLLVWLQSNSNESKSDALKLKSISVNLQKMIADAIKQQLVRDVGDIMRAVAKVGFKRLCDIDNSLFASISAAANCVLDHSAEPSDIISLNCVCEQLELTPSSFGETYRTSLLQSINKVIDKANAQETAKLLMALSKSGVQWSQPVAVNVSLLNNLVDAALYLPKVFLKMSGFAERGPSDSLDASLRANLVKAIKRNANCFNAQDLACVLTALSNLQMSSEDFAKVESTLLQAAVSLNCNTEEQKRLCFASQQLAKQGLSFKYPNPEAKSVQPGTEDKEVKSAQPKSTKFEQEAKNRGPSRRRKRRTPPLSPSLQPGSKRRCVDESSGAPEEPSSSSGPVRYC